MTAAVDRIIIPQPDDWHVHLRDGAMLGSVVGATAAQFARAIVMPNLAPPVTRASDGAAYRDRIMAAVPDGMQFTPLITCYLTNETDPDDLAAGHRDGIFTAAKLYPANATTNSAKGVTDIARIAAVLDRMQTIGMPLLIHGEVTDSHVDIFDREAVFIDRILSPMLKDFPSLRIVFEHITTADAVAFVDSAPDRVAATITPHHLRINRNAMFVGGIRPHAYCLPVAKREKHRLALRKAVTSGSAKYFLGTDSAPHLRSAKESACGCAGIYNAPYAIESYALTFEEENALDKLEGFACLNGPKFYRLPVNHRQMVLERAASVVPTEIETADGPVIPFHAGETLGWRFAGLVDPD